ncbi:ABC transporter permease [Roseospira marina]|uniref:Transport permease protein n=1 Tax=Roseospira marina TaxID=140057 RepID=A0A5M6I7C4_9PROT|nr:ABC transporter permease [Roseospira marina]KAA5604164.1 ABC transporter permease [Roseospira marina]MBB4315738.1 lipopolysaccharide transport system permease protein [Roseospira marina]MBB5088905.1 lipopolysaccharide transport system permease protein [Roseospira marina]
MKRLLLPFLVYTAHRKLIARLTRREIAQTYRGSLLGLAWALLNPLIMLGVFTFIFSVVFQARWGTEIEGHGEFALVLFCGLIVFRFFAEVMGRAPNLMLENTSYIKKVVFPLEAMPWVAAGGALFNLAASLLMLVLGFVILNGVPPWTLVLVPVVLAPYVLLILGLTWFLSAIGVFLRDLHQVVGVLVTVTMFLCPIFYPIEAVPETFRIFIYMNPLTFIIEQLRDVALFGHLPDFGLLAGYLAAAWGIALAGLWWFSRTRKGFADVV